MSYRSSFPTCFWTLFDFVWVKHSSPQTLWRVIHACLIVWCSFCKTSLFITLTSLTKKKDTIMLLDDASGSEMKGSHRSQGSESSLRRMNELTGSDMNDSEFISVLCLSKVFKRRSVYSTVVLQERKKFGSCLWCLISTAIMCCSIVVGITRFNVWASFCSLFKKKEGESLICYVDALFDVLLSGTVNH